MCPSRFKDDNVCFKGSLAAMSMLLLFIVLIVFLVLSFFCGGEGSI